MEFDDDGHDDGPVAPLLPPEDRLWRHPSEVATHPIGQRLRQAREPRLLTIVALTSSISVLLTLGVVATVRPVRTRLAIQQVAPPADPSHATDAADVAGIADRLRASITQVSVDAPAGAPRRGSAVLYRSDGLLLTAHHVVTGSATATVTFDDGRVLAAKVIGGDADTDIAVLDVEGDGFPVAPLGTASGLKVGQPAILLGTPAAARASPAVSVGVVSATGQVVEADGHLLLDMIQTDTGVRPGCSGGALVDAAGVVIGIATVNASDSAEGTGYATPIDVARLVAAQLLSNGRVTRGWLGVEGDDLSDDRAVSMGVGGGVVVKAVKDASPARAAGIAAEDVITELDGETLESMTELVVQLRTRRPGDSVSIAVVRRGERMVLRATLGEKP